MSLLCFYYKMNKRSIAKAFNEAPHNVFTQLPVPDLVLTKAPVSDTPEARAELNFAVQKYVDTFFTKAVQKKITFTKTLVTWPHSNTTLFKPYVHKVEVFRYGNKYVMLIVVNHMGE